MDKRYYSKCSKCGAIVWSEEPIPLDTLCVLPMEVRTSGICGGSYSETPTTEEIKEFESTEQAQKHIK
jgi:hypothetical protein